MHGYLNGDSRDLMINGCHRFFVRQIRPPN